VPFVAPARGARWCAKEVAGMRLCVGTANGIVILDPDRGSTPLMVLADPSSIWCMAQDSLDPGLLYAGATELASMGSTRGKGSLARSTDGGKSWTDITPGLARDEDVWALATPPDVRGEVFVGTSHARLFRSRDSGRGFVECKKFLDVPGRDKWTFPPPPHIPHVRSIVFDRRDPATMYVGVEEGGVIRSRDRGETFEVLNRGLYCDVHTIAIDPEDSQRLYATTGAGFYLSEDAGGAWRRVTRGFNRSYTIPVLVDGEAAGVVYTAAAAGPPPMWRLGAGGADALMFRSSDRGQSFEPIADAGGSARGMMMRFARDPADAAGFFAVMSDGAVIRARNHGQNVSSIAEKLPPAYDLVAMA
jgi:photosystem II stability/assembly factor-like uncharacterized protein